MESKRKEFLKSFLSALGAAEVKFSHVSDVLIEGTVIYVEDDPEERQDFSWTATENDAPPKRVMEIVKVIQKENLIDIDRLRVSEDHLYDRTRKIFSNGLSRQEFDIGLKELLSIQIPMVDDGIETDIYFIHK